MADLRISVRELVEFLLRSGDLDNRTLGSPEDAMLAGANMHRKLQAEAGDSYRAEVPMALTWVYGSEEAGWPKESGPAAAQGPDGTKIVPKEDAPAAVDEHIHIPPAHPADTERCTATAPLSVTVEGRADGIYSGEDPLYGTPAVFIDEIKTTYRRLRNIRQPAAVHLAQARCYAYIQAAQHDLKKVGVRMTYCSLTTGDIRYFHEIYDFEEISMWFAQLMEEYRPWAAFRASWKDIRTASIRAMEFPFAYRRGQRDLAAAVYRTIVLERRLFLEAPTGTGKTITTLFPAIKAVGERKADTIFYLTARTIARTAAEDTLALLRENGCAEDSSPRTGLRLKSVTLTAREKICVLEKPDCNPESCPRAKGHFSRVNAAMYDLLIHKDAFTRETITEYAATHEVCPFELGLDMSRYADLIIGDYNYLFDPRASLRHFFGESAPGSAGKGEYLFLVDEAHNLVDRGREMYSAALVRSKVQATRRQVREIWPKLGFALWKCVMELLSIRCRMTEDETSPAAKPTSAQMDVTLPSFLKDNAATAEEPSHAREGAVLSFSGDAAAGLPSAGSSSDAAKSRHTVIVPFEHRDSKPAADNPLGPPLRMEPGTDWVVLDPEEIHDLGAAAEEVHTELMSILSKERIAQQSGAARTDPLRFQKKAVWEDLLTFYYDLDHFLSMLATMDDHYVIYAQLLSRGDIMVKLFCTDPSRRLSECMDRGRASILFSATLLPITYYKALLGGTKEDYEIYAKSVFDPKRMGLFLVRDLSSRYRDRTQDNYERIAACIRSVIRERDGNYLVFFPSYAFLEEVAVRYLLQDDSVRDITPAPGDHSRQTAADDSGKVSCEAEGLEDGEILLSHDTWETGPKISLMRRKAAAPAGSEMPQWNPLRNSDVGCAYSDDAAGWRTLLLRQQRGMSEPDREAFLARFAQVRDDRSLVGFCVMGGIFSEGIDLKNDRLIGVIVVGTGLPQISAERELLREYFDRNGGRGYDYAYRCPGMNKVQQAAGRVIRTKEDVGIVVLIDERFALPANRKLFPREWRRAVLTDSRKVGHLIERFWDEWL